MTGGGGGGGGYVFCGGWKEIDAWRGLKRLILPTGNGKTDVKW